MTEKEELTQSEHARIRGYLRAFMFEHPAQAPLRIRILEHFENTVRGGAGARFRPTRLVGAALVLALFAGVGTSYAAQGSLPGDALYAVKVNLNEEIEKVMAVSPIEKAQFNAELTTRRLEELEILAAANKLTPEVSGEIQNRINEAAENFNENVVAIEVSSESPTVVEDVHSELEVTLSAHVNVLAALTEAIPDSESALAPIISTIESHVAVAREARTQKEAAAVALIAASSTESTADAAKIATKKKETARRALDTMQHLADEIIVPENASSSHQIARKAERVEKVVEAGDDYLENGEYEKALDAFQTAIRAATQAETQAAASIELKKILPALALESTTTVDSTIEAEIDEVIAAEEKAGALQP